MDTQAFKIAQEPAGSVAVKTLLLTSIVAPAKLFKTLGDERASALVAAHDEMVRELLGEVGGVEIDKADGFLLLFERPIDAVSFALSFHLNLAELAQSEDVFLTARCGIHLGEVQLRRNSSEHVARGAKPVEVDGLAKPAVARLASLATGKQTLLTQSAFELARRAAAGPEVAELRMTWMAHGPYLFKGVDEPQDVYEVGVEGFAPLAVPPDTEKAHHAVDPGDEVILGWRAAPSQPVPRRPHWTLKEKLGEGGFGEVWLAVHEKTGERRVVKFCYEAQQLRALQREVTVFRLIRETLGHRDDIARMLDWSFDEPPYTLELDFTEGGNLRIWAEEQGGIGSVPLRTRLELVAQAAEAVAAAHSVGVLHKDVKPSNILITTRGGAPKAVLTDFGIGLITDQDQLISKGITTYDLEPERWELTAGTRQYLAPELLMGRVPTVQADIYALGVLLYQMVVGDLQRPLAQGWERDVDDELLREDVACFADGSPEHRPGSALEVVRRLRGLEQRRGERDAERRAREEAERARKRRHFLTTVATVSTLFLVVVTFLALQAMKARVEAQRGKEQAEQLIDFMLFDLRDGLETIGRLDLLEKVARGSQGYFETFYEDDDDVEAAYKRTLSFLNIGDVLIDQGDTEGAMEAYRAARELVEGNVERHPTDSRWLALRGRSRHKIGDALRYQGDLEGALASYREARDMAEELVELDASNADWLFFLAASHLELGKLHRRRAELERAEASYRRGLELADRLTVAGEGHWRHWLLRIDLYIGLGQARAAEDLEGAHGSYGTARDLAARRAEAEPTNASWRRKVVWIDLEHGGVLKRLGRVDEALASYEAARDGYRELAASDPTHVDWQTGLAQSQIHVGRIRSDRGEHAAALEIFEEARKIFESLVELDPTRARWQQWVAWARILAADVHAEGGELDEARTERERAAEILKTLVEQTDELRIRATYAYALLKLGRTEAARPFVEELLAVDWKDPLFLAAVRESGLDR